MAGEIPFGSLGGQPIVSAATTMREFIEHGLDYSNWYRKANSYRCAVGAEPGMAWILMQQSTLKKLDSRQPQDLIFGLGEKSVTIKRLAIIQAQRLIMGASLDPNSLYLVQLADARWFLKRTIINARYNTMATCSTEKQCESGYLWTFLEIVEDIFTRFSSFGGFFPEFHFLETHVRGIAPDPPENLRFEGMSAWDALAQLCQQFGYFLRYDPFSGKVHILQIGLSEDPFAAADGDFRSGYGGARATLTDEQTFALAPKSLIRAANDNLLEDSESLLGSALIPESVNIVFMANDAECGEACDIDNAHGWMHRIVVTASTVKENLLELNPDASEQFQFLSSSITGTTVVLNSTKHAQFDSASLIEPTNIDDLEAEAEVMAMAYYKALGLQAHGRSVFAGILQVIPGPFISEVIWREWGDGMKTEIARWPSPVGIPRPQKVFTGGGGGGGAQQIRFSIVDPLTFTNPCEALAYVLSRPPGVTSVEEEYGGTVYVQDRVGCFLNAPAEDLIGRGGYATYLTVDPDIDIDFVPGAICPGMNRSGWEITYLCCPQDRCDA
ncbi:MAG: hypothetical protein V4719_10815 [Planctomycetota bacterium]